MKGQMLLLLALVGEAVQTPPEAKSQAEQTWRYAQSACVRLFIQSEPPIPEGRKVTCSVVGPGAHGGQVTSMLQREFRGGEFTAYYPNDFARRPFPGRYSWGCDVEQGVHAAGVFVIRDDGTIASPARE